ncbi:MAG: hypothetical protein R3E88_20685 [Myxococcota bacterium]
MSALRSIAIDARHRARRWDAIVLGSGVPALVAAARIGLHGHRVLVVGEEAAAKLAAPLREPFLLAGAQNGGALEATLRELKLPLIDRRRFQPDALAYQVVGPELRLDVGGLAHGADELVAWGLAKPEEARALVDALAQAGELERQHLLASPVVRSGGLRALARGAAPAPATAPRGARGLPPEVANAPAALGRVFAAQVRALAGHASGGPSGEACARVLGDAQAGGACVEPGSPGLLDVLRRRVESLYGELRSVRGAAFELVNANGLPGLALRESGEVWLGKALVVAVSPSALAAAIAADAASRAGGRADDASAAAPIARALGARAPGAARRLVLHYRAPAAGLPEGMGARVVLLTRPDAKDPQDGVASLAVHAPGPRAERVDLVVRTLPAADETPADAAARVEAALRELMPFAAAGLERVRTELPRWDDDEWLEELPAGGTWPAEAELRVSSRPPVYRLDRPALAGLGLEGDLVLGWRSGDAIAADLA